MIYLSKGAQRIRDKRAKDLAQGVKLWVAFLVVPDTSEAGTGLDTREHQAWVKWRNGQPLGMSVLARDLGSNVFHAARQFYDAEG